MTTEKPKNDRKVAQEKPKSGLTHYVFPKDWTEQDFDRWLDELSAELGVEKEDEETSDAS